MVGRELVAEHQRLRHAGHAGADPPLERADVATDDPGQHLEPVGRRVEHDRERERRALRHGVSHLAPRGGAARAGGQ